MAVRGLRGATTADSNTRQAIIDATKELLTELAQANQLAIPEIASIIFTVTPDLNADFPAAAARELGWDETSLLCGREIDVPGGLKLCIRVLLHINTDLPQQAIKHIYLKEARNLRR